MRESFKDSYEDFYYTTTTTDIFDFTAVDTLSEEIDLAKSHTKFLGRGFFGVLSVLKLLTLNSAGLLLEFSVFLLAYFTYLHKKVVQFIAFLDNSKDRIVSGLMWRRGLIFRPATHGGVVTMVAIAVVAGGLFSRGQIAAQDLTGEDSIIRAKTTTQTIVPTNRPRSELVSYQVLEGDTISNLAGKFQVSVESIKWASNLTSDTINPGDTLKVPPVTGVVYKVKQGDSLDTVAKYYSADKQTIVDFPFNYIDESLSLKVGQMLVIPNGTVPAPVVKTPVLANTPRRSSAVLSGSGMLGWPVPRQISQYFSWYHQALDIADPYGTPVYAAAAGTVIDSQKLTYSFGWYCIVDMGNGYTAAYAHMSDLACYKGQRVERGTYIGAVGTTGRSTGPHLHFEVRRNGVGVDPLTLLP